MVTVSGNPNSTNLTTKYCCEFVNLNCIYTRGGIDKWVVPVVQSLTEDAAKTVVNAFISMCLDYCVEYLICYCGVYSPSKMKRHVWSLELHDVITLRRSCTVYTGYQCNSEWRSSLLFWCTRHWTIEHQNACRRTAGL